MGRLNYSTTDINEKLTEVGNFSGKTVTTDINTQSGDDKIPTAKAVRDFITAQIEAITGDEIKISASDNTTINEKIEEVEQLYTTVTLTIEGVEQEAPTTWEYEVAIKSSATEIDNNEVVENAN